MIKNGKQTPILNWSGMDQWTDTHEVPSDRWINSINVVVSPSRNALALRSPANFNDTLSNSKPILSVAYYDRLAGGQMIFDTETSGTTRVTTYSTTGSSNTSLRTNQAASARFTSLNVSDRLYRVNGTEYIQYVTSGSAYAVGITKPSAAPTLSFVAGGSGTLTTGVTVSYAYRNSTTTDVGECSTASASSGASTNTTLRIAVVASTQTGVDGIVIFVTQDGGSVRYLYSDTNGDPIVYGNTTGNIDISNANLVNLNYNVEETAFNVPPPQDGTHISSWRNRVIVAGFSGATSRQQIVYSGFDQIFYGSPWACYPPLNVITIPNKAESVKGGIETQVGWLGLSERDAYLLTGAPTDKVDAGENTLQITEQFRQLKWGIGTRSILTLKNTQYGSMWFDQNKHIQFWPWTGAAKPVCQGLWTDLETVLDTDAARAMAEAEWFQVGKNGGFYVLTACTTGSTNNRMWFITVIEHQGELFIGGAPSDIAAQCIAVGILSGDTKCLIGVTDRLREILDFDTAGAGWSSTQRIYFTIVAGALLGNFSSLHSLRMDGTNVQDIIIRATNANGSNSVTGQPFFEDGTLFTVLNQYGTLQKVTFEYPTDDTVKHEITDVRLMHSLKARAV